MVFRRRRYSNAGCNYRQLTGDRNTFLEVEYDGRRREGKALLIAIGNGSCYGGGLHIIPPAVLDDGYFHICLVRDVGKIETMRLLPSVYHGGHIGHPDVEILKARRVTVRAPVPLTVQADGEIIGTLPLSVEAAPRVLSVLAPHCPPESARSVPNGRIRQITARDVTYEKGN
ncbi:MAG: hypothetical protein AB1767_10930 [Bacillota bacterium]